MKEMEVEESIDDFISPAKKRKVEMSDASEQSFKMPDLTVEQGGDNTIAVPVVVPKLRAKDLMDSVEVANTAPVPRSVIVTLGYDEVSNPKTHSVVRSEKVPNDTIDDSSQLSSLQILPAVLRIHFLVFSLFFLMVRNHLIS
jgi:hypothetical protein